MEQKNNSGSHTGVQMFGCCCSLTGPSI